MSLQQFLTKYTARATAALIVGVVILYASMASAQTATTTVDIEYNQSLEDILNEVIEPITPSPLPTPSQSTTTPTNPGTSTPPVAGPVNPNPTTPTPTPRPQPTPVTPVVPSTPAQTDTNSSVTTPTTFERTTNGQSNEYLPSNYYTPLDNLSPEVTYALCGLAMILGLSGAFLILREPETSVVWTPALQTQEPLLEQ